MLKPEKESPPFRVGWRSSNAPCRWVICPAFETTAPLACRAGGGWRCSWGSSSLASSALLWGMLLVAGLVVAPWRKVFVAYGTTG